MTNVLNQIADFLLGLTDDETLFYLGMVMTVTTIMVVGVVTRLVLDDPETKRRKLPVETMANHFPEMDQR